MTGTSISKRLAKAISARRKILHHLDCVSRQIAATASRQTKTVIAWSRPRRRSISRLSHKGLVDRFTFER